jgi:hypothetical protein
MRDLSWVRKQGQIVAREKKKIRQELHIPPKTKFDSFAELYEVFEQRFKDTEPIFAGKRMSEKIELQERMRAINRPHN